MCVWKDCKNCDKVQFLGVKDGDGNGNGREGSVGRREGRLALPCLASLEGAVNRRESGTVPIRSPSFGLALRSASLEKKEKVQ